MPTLDQRLKRLSLARLYAIVDTGYVEPARVSHVTQQLVLGGVDLIQLRAKKLPLAAISELGEKMRAIIPSAGSNAGPLFILNDHPKLVPEVGADGIHVGQDDLSVAVARQQAGAGALVGKSTHSLEQAIAAEKEGADYIGVGPIYATPTKPDYVPVGPALIDQVRTAVRVPQFCIGGINEKTLPEIVTVGARRVVIVSALLQSSDIPAYCRWVREQLETSPTFLKMGFWETLFGPFFRDDQIIRRVREKLSKYPQLNAESFATTYFPEEKQAIAKKLWEITKEHSVADITGLRPEDEFVADLKMDDLDSLSTVEILTHIERDFEVDITDERAVRIRTFGDLVDEIYRLKRNGIVRDR